MNNKTTIDREDYLSVGYLIINILLTFNFFVIMKKQLLCGLFALMLGGQAMAQSQLDTPNLAWGFYACISKVEINGMVSEFSTTPDGWNGKIGSNSYDEATQFGDLTMDETKIINLKPEGEYDLNVTVCNFSSGAGDKYYLTVYFDWDGNNILTKAETVHQEILTLAAPGQDSFIARTYKIIVPKDVAATCTMRVYLHYYTNDVPYDQNDPLCDQDGGMLKDYKVVTGASAISNVGTESFSVYPNPTEGVLFIESEGVGEYILYSVDGKMVQKGMIMDGAINVAGNQPGIYILKVQTGNEVKQTNIIIK